MKKTAAVRFRLAAVGSLRSLVVTTSYDARNFCTALCLFWSFGAVVAAAFLHYTFHNWVVFNE